MSTPCPSPAERARKIESMILQRLQPVGTQAAIAAIWCCSDSSITRLKNHLPELSLLMAHLGLKTVPVEHQCTHPGELSYLRELRRRVEDHAAHLLNEEG